MVDWVGWHGAPGRGAGAGCLRVALGRRWRAPTARPTPAQGNALGIGPKSAQSPEGAAQSVGGITPFSSKELRWGRWGTGSRALAWRDRWGAALFQTLGAVPGPGRRAWPWAACLALGGVMPPWAVSLVLPKPQRGFASQPRARPWVRFGSAPARSEGAPHPGE